MVEEMLDGRNAWCVDALGAVCGVLSMSLLYVLDL